MMIWNKLGEKLPGMPLDIPLKDYLDSNWGYKPHPEGSWVHSLASGPRLHKKNKNSKV